MNKIIYIVTLLSLTCLNVSVICLTFYIKHIPNNTRNMLYEQNTKEIIHLQDSMIKELSDILWFEYNYDLPQFDSDYTETIDELKKEINL